MMPAGLISLIKADRCGLTHPQVRKEVFRRQPYFRGSQFCPRTGSVKLVHSAPCKPLETSLVKTMVGRAPAGTERWRESSVGFSDRKRRTHEEGWSEGKTFLHRYFEVSEVLLPDSLHRTSETVWWRGRGSECRTCQGDLGCFTVQNVHVWVL